MNWHSLLHFGRAHEGLVSFGVLCVTMGMAWLRMCRISRGEAGCRAPEHWYTGYQPPPFVEASRWDLRHLHGSPPRKPAGRARKTAPPQDTPPEAAERER